MHDARATVLVVDDEPTIGEVVSRFALPDGRTAYTFTMFQGPECPTSCFDAQHASLQREFANIERLFKG